MPGLWISTNEIQGANVKYYSEVARAHGKVQHSVNASVKLSKLLNFLLVQKEDFGSSFTDQKHEEVIQKLNFWCKMETAASNWLLGDQRFPITILKLLAAEESESQVNKPDLPLIFSTLVS